MKVFDDLEVIDVFRQFSGGLIVAHPLDQVLESTVACSSISDLLDSVLAVVIDLDRWRQ